MLEERSISWKSPDYYFFPDDMAKYPEAWCYVVYSRRGPGKTYSALRYAYEEDIKMVYLKRTIDDVNIICADKKGIDMSPYVPINRDGHYSIKPQLISKGIGGFYDKYDDEGNLIGAPFAYCIALNAMKTVKGMDLSICDWMLLDEFIPQSGEIVKHAEGEMLLDLYMTIRRDRLKRGREDLKLILFANSENISTPITNELEIVDAMADLNASGKTHLYLEDRGIMIHHITETEIPLKEDKDSGIMRAMEGTAWAAKAFGGEFANNDFSNIGHSRLKNYQPVCGYIYKRRCYYVYRKDEEYYICRARHDGEVYDLARESEQNRFYYDHILDLREAFIDGHLTCQKYSMYDLIVNYKKFFRIV